MRSSILVTALGSCLACACSAQPLGTGIPALEPTVGNEVEQPAKSVAPPPSSTTFGSIVGSVGDFDGDGRDDVVIGDSHPDRDCPEAGLWVLSSKDDRELFALHSLPRPSDAGGALAFQGLNWTVHRIGDCNADGTPDLLVALVRECGGSLHAVSGRDRRSLWIHDAPKRLSSGPTSLCVALPSKRVAFLEGDGDTDELTARVLSAVDGHEIDRFPIQNEQRCKHVAITSLASAGADGWVVLLEPFTFDRSTDLEQAPARRTVLRSYSADGRRVRWSCDLGSSSHAWGTELVELDDLDADGDPDLAASFAEGVEVLSGRTGHTIRRFDMTRDGWSEGLGCALVAPGDLDGDGAADIVMGHFDARLYWGAVIAKSGRDGRELWSQMGLESDDQHHLGYCMATLNDIDGDHVPDLLAGTLHAIAGKPGLAVLFSGATGRPICSYRREGARVIVTRHP